MSSSFDRVFSHSPMLADRVRMESYRKAIHETVRPGDVVCDIGTGSGILAFFALQAGAGKVYAIEQSEIIEEARKLAQLNGFEKRIIFVKGESDKINLPEKVDVIISELIGFFGIEENLPHFKIDARDRFLKTNGRLLPHWLELYIAPVQFSEFWNDKIGLYNQDFYGLDFSPVRKTAAEHRYTPDCSNKIIFIAKPVLILRLDFYEIKSIPSFYSTDFTIDKNGDLHGLVGYFKAGLSRNIILSTAPQEPVTIWGQSFFPLQETFAAQKGDIIKYKMKPIPQKNNFFWQWDTDIFRNEKQIAGFSQTSFKIDKEELIIGRGDFKPNLTKNAEIYRNILNLCDGGRTVEEIAGIVFKEYPENLKNTRDAMKEVISIIQGKVKIS